MAMLDGSKNESKDVREMGKVVYSFQSYDEVSKQW